MKKEPLFCCLGAEGRWKVRKEYQALKNAIIFSSGKTIFFKVNSDYFLKDTLKPY